MLLFCINASGQKGLTAGPFILKPAETGRFQSFAVVQEIAGEGKGRDFRPFQWWQPLHWV